MKLSIITICYNIKDEIKRTCESIANQTWQDFEWIVVDGGSTDGTLELLNEYKDRINILISKKDNGVYDAMNKGILKATGEHLNFMNGGDCFYDNDVLKFLFKENTFTQDIFYGGEKYLFRGNETIINEKHNFKNPIFWHYKYKLKHQASFIRKELFDKYGLYDLRYKSASDFEMFIRFICINKCSTLHIDKMLSRFYADGGMSSENQENSRRECYEILENNKIKVSKTRKRSLLFMNFMLRKLAQITPHKALRKKMRYHMSWTKHLKIN